MKKILALLLGSAAVFTLSACVNDDEVKDPSIDDNTELPGTGGDNDEEQTNPEENKIVPQYSISGIENHEYVWGDEFNYTGKPDSKYWGYDLGDGTSHGIPGWGNNEEQYYTDSEKNAYVDNGVLTITAIKERTGNKNYSSARLVTKGMADFTYGYVEISAKMPPQLGSWTALWMLPTENKYGGWPNSGEIDIMEHKGQDKTKVLGTLHTGYRNWMNGQYGNANGGELYKPSATETYVTYGMLWTEDKIEFYLDGVKYFTEERLKLKDYVAGAADDHMHWPFDEDFHFIFNIAMGGMLGGDIPSSFTEAKMEVDYVRVFQEKK